MQFLTSFFRTKTDTENTPLLEKSAPQKKSSGYEEIKEETVIKTKGICNELLLKKTES